VSALVSLVLASASPQRRAILEQLGVAFSVVAPQVEELRGGHPAEMVVENARRKARAVEGERVLGADTAVVLDGAVIGKPAGREHAAELLSALSGRAHEVVSGIVLRSGASELAGHGGATVRFRPLAARDIESYLATGEWRGRAGGYAIQGRGAALVEAVEGDFYAVVGLPVAELVRLAPELVGGLSRPGG
jgi:septum formation protein